MTLSCYKSLQERQNVSAGPDQLTFVDAKPAIDTKPIATEAKPPVAAAAQTPPAAPKQDEGAFISLDHLAKGDLQEFIPGTAEDKGLSEKQIEKLKTAVNGETIGDLEKFQKAKGEWWVKEIGGFGPETITKLQDAYEIVRRKFPVPDPDEPAQNSSTESQATPVQTPALPVAAVSDTEDQSPAEPLDAEEAEEQLEELIDQCEEIQKDTTNLEAIRFTRSVQTQAKSMLENLQGKDQTTPDQARAIRNWRTGVSKWYDQDLDQDELDLDDAGDE